MSDTSVIAILGLVLILAFVSIFFGITLINTLFGPFLGKTSRKLSDEELPFLSVCVPARNEEHNITRLINGLAQQKYPHFEVLVWNDRSTDATGNLLDSLSSEYPFLRVFHSHDEPPKGWTGKNYACHSLSQRANGEILIFTDADNIHEPHALRATVERMQRLSLDMLSAFPEQITGTFAEKLAIPVVDMFVYSGLPLWLTYYAPFPSLAAANGQWIAFRREAYSLIGGHQAVKNQVVEDVSLARITKKIRVHGKRLRMLTTAGTDTIYCRMYSSRAEVEQGFGKNLFGLTDYRTSIFFSIFAVLFVMYVIPYLIAGFRILDVFVFSSPISAYFDGLLCVSISLMLAQRALLAWRFQHPFWVGIIFHPFSILYILYISVISFRNVRAGFVEWKGRKIQVFTSQK